MSTEMKMIAAYALAVGFGYIVCLIQVYLNEEYPTDREIKRRMKQYKPRVK